MEANPDPLNRNLFGQEQQQEIELPLLAADLEAIGKALKDPANALLSDRLLMVMQNILKVMDQKEVAKVFGDLRTVTWFKMSQHALQERGLVEAPQGNLSSFQKMKAFVDAINDVSTVVWTPVSLINRYGLQTLGAISQTIGFGAHSKAFEDVCKQLLPKVAVGRYELDAMQKLLALTIAYKKGFTSADFIRASLEVGRISSQYLGYDQTSYLLGIVSASIGAWQVWSRK
jgi:hypothetical protein